MPTITDYTEKYRSQYHFSPVYGWVGDLDGLIYYQGKYHLFWWGKATSTDLVHFDQVTIDRGFALTGDPGLGDYYTGGAVVDLNNTAGFGEGALIPIYTIPTAEQKQGLSYSVDETLDTFQYYSGNPVLEKEGERDFRDPTVFWHEESNCWVMVIALPTQKKISFYRSDDLKEWTWLSDFGQIGAQEGLWECPDLFQLSLEDGTKKWVLIVSVGPNKEQYFVGDFDGTQFTLDKNVEEYLKNGVGMDGEVFADFGTNGLEGWTVEGNAFDIAPSNRISQNYLGDGLATSGASGNDKTGAITSREFVIEKNAINFLISGGAHKERLTMELLVDGEVVRSALGDLTTYMKWKGWDVSDLIGKTAQIRITDKSSGNWGYLDVDHILFSDVLYNTNREHALWVDNGMDFYASRTFRDYDGTLDETFWLGWMGNWDYANYAPAIQVTEDKDLRGVWSLARSLSLTTVNGLPQLIQKPVEGLKDLRNKETTLERTLSEGVHTFSEFQPDSNVYEIEATFRTEGDNEFGFNLMVGEERQLVVGYDTATSTLYVDRTNCADTQIVSFNRVMSAPLAAKDGEIKLHIYVDKNSIEIFANDGESVYTAVTYAGEEQTGIELFSQKADATTMQFSGWTLDSIWPGHIQAAPVYVDDGDKQLDYTGDWTVFENDNTYANGDCHVTDGGSVTMEFRGSSVDWYGLVNSDLGIAEVYIDGELDREIDCYSPTRRRQKLYSKTQLGEGTHTITIKAKQSKNPASSGTAIVHDMLLYLPTAK